VNGLSMKRRMAVKRKMNKNQQERQRRCLSCCFCWEQEKPPEKAALSFLKKQIVHYIFQANLSFKSALL